MYNRQGYYGDHSYNYHPTHIHENEEEKRKRYHHQVPVDTTEDVSTPATLWRGSSWSNYRLPRPVYQFQNVTYSSNFSTQPIECSDRNNNDASFYDSNFGMPESTQVQEDCYPLADHPDTIDDVQILQNGSSIETVIENFTDSFLSCCSSIATDRKHEPEQASICSWYGSAWENYFAPCSDSINGTKSKTTNDYTDYEFQEQKIPHKSNKRRSTSPVHVSTHQSNKKKVVCAEFFSDHCEQLHIDEGNISSIQAKPDEGNMYLSPVKATSTFEIHNEYGINDVLCGRGVSNTDHQGNNYFRSLIKLYASKYAAARRTDKPAIAKHIVELIKQNNGGRFIKRTKINNNTFHWNELTDDGSYERVCHALRLVSGNQYEIICDKEKQKLTTTIAKVKQNYQIKPIIVPAHIYVGNKDERSDIHVGYNEHRSVLNVGQKEQRSDNECSREYQNTFYQFY